MRYSHEDDYSDEEDERKNYFNNDDDHDEDETEFDEDYFDDMIDAKYHQDNQKVKILEYLIKQQNLKRQILMDSIQTLQKSFWWNFCSLETRLSWISRTYEKFSDLIFGPPDEKNESEDEDAII